MARLESQPIDLCMFKRVTGLPCPTCGVSRCAWRLIRGDVPGAVRHQPFMFVAGVLFVAIMILRVGFARRIEWDMSKRARLIAAGVVIAAFLANWWYVIVFLG